MKVKQVWDVGLTRGGQRFLAILVQSIVYLRVLRTNICINYNNTMLSTVLTQHQGSARWHSETEFEKNQHFNVDVDFFSISMLMLINISTFFNISTFQQ